MDILAVCLNLYCLFSFGIVLSFNANLDDFLSVRFGLDSTTSGYLAALPTLGCAIVGPFIGYLIDKYG